MGRHESGEDHSEEARERGRVMDSFHVFASEEEIIKKTECIHPIQPSFGKIEDTWIKCSERLPNEEGEYLVRLAGGVMVMKWYGIHNPNRPWSFTGWKLPYEFTHWMPLPEAPKEE